ncbi:integrase family protein [Desulfocurvibacter africanus PCS]|uniref:Integrase family protein n=1 Tax=Desulfocurvibacter africanus PCS TaxID=1262666 RepID=M5PSI0_DESAF|nr:DDE-type integrase/transposase/recombinase [Desulfocurvibacter africanus]EMG37332.1 integrase family protein [Desulfocurvibacter africanus PCS]
MSLAYRAMCAILERDGKPVPSEISCRRFLRRYAAEHQDIVVLRRQGEKALKDKVGPFILRQDKILKVGDVIFADGHDLNFEVLHPETGKPHRPTLVMWMDWRSRMPIGWEIMPTESAVAIASALRMAIANLGKYPRVPYIDNGKAFKAKYFTKSESELRELDGLYARLGMTVQFSRPYEARTKIIERFFRTFDEQCQRLLPSYCGNNIEHKPAWRRRNEAYHQARKSDWIPTIREAAEIVRLYVGWYARQPHRGLGGQTPAEVFMAGRGAGVDTAELDRHFLWTRKVRPSRCGFTLAGMRYESDCLYGLNKDILVKYSWADLSQVHLFELDNTPIGQAAPTEAIHPLARHFGDELDLLKVQEANKRQRQLKQQTMNLARELDVSVQDSGLSELPWMRREKQSLRSVPKPKAKAEPAGLTPERRAELEALGKALQAAPTDIRPAYSAPEYFASTIDRYDFLFDVSVKQGLALAPDDAAWMANFEASDEFRDIAGDSYAKLRAIYQSRTEEALS